MKIVLVLIFSVVAYCDNLLVLDSQEENTSKIFLKSDNGCYYPDSFVKATNCYKQTGNIFVAADKSLEKEFLKKYNLQYLRKVNKQKAVSLYKVVKSPFDIIDLVNKINNENDACTARVEWLKPRRLF